MDSSFIIAQIASFLAMICYIISTQTNDRHRVLRWRTLYSTVYALQYLFLGAYSGVVSSVTPIVRNIVYDKSKKQPPVLWIIVFSILTLVPGIFLCDTVIDLLPLLHTVVCTVFIGFGNLTVFRVSQLIAFPLVLIYNFSVDAYIGILIVVLQFISTFIGFIRFDIPKWRKKSKKAHRKTYHSSRAQKNMLK